jgi:peptide-methionine (S)-S-oxide reductase
MTIESQSTSTTESRNLEQAIFAGGCFWCTEAVFLQLEGVIEVESGYIGGKTINPTYTEICSGETGHAEAVRITFDLTKITFADLLHVFFATHDPTTLNRQGNDIGSQYRSEIFYIDQDQFQVAKEYLEVLSASQIFAKPIVTKVSRASNFYIAEDYHQNYYNLNQSQGYCEYVITPKIEKLRAMFSSKLKQKVN